MQKHFCGLRILFWTCGVSFFFFLFFLILWLCIFRWETLQVFMGRLRVALCKKWWAHQTLQEAHWSKAIQMQSLRQVSALKTRYSWSPWANTRESRSSREQGFILMLLQPISVDCCLIWGVLEKIMSYRSNTSLLFSMALGSPSQQRPPLLDAN